MTATKIKKSSKIEESYVFKTFLELTDHLYPHGRTGTDESRVKDFNKRAKKLYGMLPADIKRDDYGNLYKVIGDGSTSVMFTAHLDTATDADGKVKHKIEGDFIKTDGKTLLGADDKTGMAIMMYMMENKVPGLYYFFLGEEVGCLGSKWLGKELEKDKGHETNPLYKNIKKVISLDRKAYTSVISFQASTRTASDEFCDELSKQLNLQHKDFKYATDDTGMNTDSARIAHLFPECTNLSVGYFDQHQKKEKQDYKFMYNLAEACIKIDWEALPVKRDHTKKESKYANRSNNYSSNNYNRSNSAYNSAYNTNSRSSSSNKPASRNSYSFTGKDKANVFETEFWYDDKFEYLCEFNYSDGEVINVDLAQERVDFELKLIRDVFNYLEIPFTKLEWDGVELEIESTIEDSEMTREDLYEFVPELDYQNQD
jgi:hypothetical protein